MPEDPARSIGPARIVACDELDSTNSEALRRALQGETGPLWITANAQTHGRGRSGRAWNSPHGNLYASLLFQPGCKPELVHQLSLLAGVAVHDAIGSVGVLPGLRLKWPNDVLVGTAKLAGILSESVVGSAGEPFAILGIGLNLVASPTDTPRPATCLAAHGLTVAPTAALQAIDKALFRRLSVWQAGLGFAAIRTAWLERAGPLGETLAVITGEGRIEGSFGGLDPDGALLLKDPDGCEHRFSFGDVTVVPQLSEA